MELTVHGLDVGLEGYQREWDATTMMARSAYQPQFAIPSGTMRSVGVYVDHSRVFGRIRLDAGGRLDYVRSAADPALANTDLYMVYKGTRSVAATDLTPSARTRVTVDISPGFTLSAGIGRTVRVPDPQERYFALRRMPTDWVGDPALRPTTNTGVDVSLAIRRRALAVSVTAFHDSLDDYVVVHGQARQFAVPGVANTAARSFTNIDARISGGEAEASLSLTDRLSVVGGLSYSRGTRDLAPTRGITTRDLPEMPAARSRFAIKYQSARASAEAETIAVGRQDHVDSTLGEAPTAAYALVNLRAAWRFGAMKVSAALNNVLDAAYYEHLSYQRDPYRSGVRIFEPGRNLYVNVGVGF